ENWGVEGLSGDSIRLNRREVPETNVCELIDDTNDGWMEERVMEIYGDYMGDQICKIPILHNGPDDYRIWFDSPLGSYSTKSALVWKLNTLPKIKIFCWRIGHDILPTYENISKIRMEFSCLCPRCGSEEETLMHALKDCPKARAVLIHGGFDNALLDGSYWRCVDWIEDVARSLDKKALSDFVTVLWNIWNSRNNKVFRNTEEDAKAIWDRAATLNRDFRTFNFMERPMIPKPVEEKGWQKPRLGVVKINFDAAVEGRRMSFGVVARDHDGFVLGGRAGVLESNAGAEWAELQALAECLELAREKRWLKLEVESDCANLVNRLKWARVDFSTYGFRIRQLLNSFDPCIVFNFKFVWTPRCCNKAADQLCKWAFKNNCTKAFDMDYPIEIHDVILNDAIN
ncbi:hypothetical protein Goklo_028040, partial [Gossypium klotzschianum]|nr:hypothetical protein [Gossypium klotzschianum]